jgi:nucleoid-associated protein YgaU
VRLQADEEISKLRRDNEELRAELAVLRGGGAMPVSRTPRMINVPNEPRSAIALPTAPVNDAPIIPAPSRPKPVEQPMIQPVLPAAARATPPAAKPSATTQSAARQSAAKPPPAKSAPAGNRAHTVAASDSLWKIARQYYGSNASAAQVRGIVEANRGVISSETAPLKPGMVLKIP